MRHRPLPPRRIPRLRAELMQTHPGLVLPQDQALLAGCARLDLRIDIGKPRLDHHRVGLQRPLRRPLEREPPARQVPPDRREIKPDPALALDQLLHRAPRPQQRRDPQLVRMAALDRLNQPRLLGPREHHLRLRVPAPPALRKRFPATLPVALLPAPDLTLMHPQGLRNLNLSPALQQQLHTAHAQRLLSILRQRPRVTLKHSRILPQTGPICRPP